MVCHRQNPSVVGQLIDRMTGCSTDQAIRTALQVLSYIAIKYKVLAGSVQEPPALLIESTGCSLVTGSVCQPSLGGSLR